MATIQSFEEEVAFIFVGDMNGHHQEWLGSACTARHGIAAFEFSIVSYWENLVAGPIHQAGGTLDFVFTDVPGRVRISVVEDIEDISHEVSLQFNFDWEAVRAAVLVFPLRDVRLCEDTGGYHEYLLSQSVHRFV